MLALGILAAACGGFVEVTPEIKWVEGTNLFLAVCLTPGARKSPAYRTMTKPLLDYEREIQGEAAAERAEVRTSRLLAEAALKEADAAATEKPNDKKLKAKAVKAREALEGLVVPGQPRMLAEDVTPEALVTMLGLNGDRIAIASEEGGILGTIAGRYSGVPNLDV